MWLESDCAVSVNLGDNKRGAAASERIEQHPSEFLRAVLGDELRRKTRDKVEPPMDRMLLGGGVRGKPVGGYPPRITSDY